MNQESEREFLDMRSYGERVTGPVVYGFVDWVIGEALSRGITTLWFLSRDGYLPYLVAKRICIARDISVECRYFYCSRRSLRSASYHLVDDEELSSYVLTRGYMTSADTIFARLGITSKKYEELLLKADIKSPATPLSISDFSKLCGFIRYDSEIFAELRRSSAISYRSAAEYILDSGITEGGTVAIVDSGWTGSMQRSLRILLDSLGYRGRLIGFYFGMYGEGRREDGEYLCYYFSARHGLVRRVLFNNNLLECMLSAPHAMTLEYERREGCATPVFAIDHDEKMLCLISSQMSGALAFCDKINKENERKCKAEINICKISRKLRRAMIYPSRADAELMSHFVFSDDFTEQYKLSLADGSMLNVLREYTVFRRIFRRILKRQKPAAELFWSYGVVAYLPMYKQPFYRMNLLIWDFFKALRERLCSLSLGRWLGVK